MRGMKKTRSRRRGRRFSRPQISTRDWKFWQVIVDEAVGQLSQLVAKEHLEGELKVPPVEAKQRVEFIGVQMILDLGTVDPAKYPLPHTRLTLESLRDYVHLRPRTNTISAIARFRNALAYATHTFFQNHGFLYVHTPVITTSDCEGAGEMFQLTTLISDAEKLEELIKIPPPAEADGEVAKLLVMEKGEAIAQLKSAKANKETISAAVAELTKAKESLSKLEERFKLTRTGRLTTPKISLTDKHF